MKFQYFFNKKLDNNSFCTYTVHKFIKTGYGDNNKKRKKMKKEMNFELTRAREQELKRTKKNILLERIALAFVAPYLLGRLSVRVPGNVRKRIKDKKPISGEFTKPFVKTKRFVKEGIQESGDNLNKLYERYAQEDAKVNEEYEEKLRREAEIEEKNKAFEREKLRLEQEETQNRLNAENKGINEIIKIMEKKIVSVENKKDDLTVVLDNGSKIIIASSKLTVSDFLGAGNSIELSDYEYNLLKNAIKGICENVERFNMLTKKNQMLYVLTKERKL